MRAVCCGGIIAVCIMNSMSASSFRTRSCIKNRIFLFFFFFFFPTTTRCCRDFKARKGGAEASGDFVLESRWQVWSCWAHQMFRWRRTESTLGGQNGWESRGLTVSLSLRSHRGLLFINSDTQRFLCRVGRLSSPLSDSRPITEHRDCVVAFLQCYIHERGGRVRSGVWLTNWVTVRARGTLVLFFADDDHTFLKKLSEQKKFALKTKKKKKRILSLIRGRS